MAQSTTRALAAADLDAADFDVVVTLDASGGQERRFAARPLTVPSRLLRTVAVDGGLLQEPEIPERAGSVRDASVQMSGSLDVELASDAAAWLRTTAQRTPIQRTRVEVAILPDGADWEDRVVVYEGVLRTPTFDPVRGRAAFSIAQQSLDGAGFVPDRIVANGVISGAPEKSQGELMPWLYGSLVREVAGIVVLEATDDNRVLVAGHWVRKGNVVTVHRTGTNGQEVDLTMGVTNTQDEVGMPYSYVSLTDVEYWADNPTNTQAFAIAVSSPGRLGGTHGFAAQKEIRLLGDVLLDILLAGSGVRFGTNDHSVTLARGQVDVASFKAINDLLPIEVSLQLTTGRRAVEWVRAICSDLPVSVGWEGGVLRARVGAMRAGAREEVAARLAWGAEILDLAAPYEEESIEAVSNGFQVRYDWRNRAQRWAKALMLISPNDAECRVSEGRYGHRAYGSQVDLWMISDDASANLVARELVARASHVRTRATYVTEAGATRHLQPFDRVEVSHPDAGLEAAQFIVERVADQGDGTVLLGVASRFELEPEGGADA